MVTPQQLCYQLYYYGQSLRSYTLPKGELEQLQLRRLRATLLYADKNVPHCHETFRRFGLDPEDVGGPEDLRRLPIISRPEILKLHEEAQRSGRAQGAILLTTSGTSTGQRSIMALSKRERAIISAVSLRKKTKFGLRPWSRVATLWSPERFWRNEMKGGTFTPMTGSQRSMLGFRPPNLLPVWVDPSDPAKDGRKLADFKPEFIFGRPSYLRRIARNGGADLRLRARAVVTTGEIITDACREELRNTFGAKILRQYGAAGYGGLGFDCNYETGLHTNEDYRIYEVLKDGEPVAEGEVGELVITNLYPQLVPVLRFRTGDFVRLGPKDRCKCGSSSRRLICVEGRENDWIVGLDGSKFLALEVANRIESGFGLRDFRLIQKGVGAFTLLLGKDDIKYGSATAPIKEYLEALTGTEVRLDVEARTEEDYWLKVRPVVTEVPLREADTTLSLGTSLTEIK